jgi:glycosyltransferase involved in cell wall biosynthesis
MSKPYFSIIVPTCGRPVRLGACLDALARLEPPSGGLEVIVVDDGSPSPIAPVVRPYEDRMDVTVIRQENAGPAAARNAGAARARGTLLGFTDDDCRPEPGWARAMVQGAHAHPGCLLAGTTVNELVGNPFATASQLLIDYLYEYFGPESGRVPLVTSNNLALPAEGYHSVGGFDSSFPLAAGEDRDFCARWHEAQRPIAVVVDAVVCHAHPMGFLGFWRQHANYGRGAYHYHRLRQHKTLQPEPIKFYTDLIYYPIRNAEGMRSWIHAGLLGISQLANVVGYAVARWAGEEK